MIKADSEGRNNFIWWKGFALPRLFSRPQEGSVEECGRVSDWGVFGNSVANFKSTLIF